MLCKLYLIQKGSKWYGVYTCPEGSARDINKHKGNLVSKFTCISREVYRSKLSIIELEG